MAHTNAVIDQLVSAYLNGEDPSVETAANTTKMELFEGSVTKEKGNFDLRTVVKTLPDSLFVTRLDVDQIPAEIRSLVPELNENYIPEPEALIAVANAIENNEPILITGPTGCGKSELLAFICAVTNRPFIRINMTEDIDSSMVFGQIGAANGATYWDNGPAAEAGIYGAVLNIDEYDAAPAGIAMGFQWMLEHKGKMYLKEKPGSSMDKTIQLHPNFRVAFTGNTLGQGDDTGHYAGTQVQNTAMIDRIRCAIQMDYMKPIQELAMLRKAYPMVNKEVQKQMIQIANTVRQAYKKMEVGLTISPRTLLNWNAKLLVYKHPRKAFEYAYLNKLRESDAKVVVKVFERSFSEKTEYVAEADKGK